MRAKQSLMKFVLVLVAALMGLSMTPAAPAAEQTQPLTFVYISNPLLIANIERLPPNRKFIEQNSAAVLSVSDAINKMAPKFLVLAGNITWGGLEQDIQLARTTFKAFSVPIYPIAGDKDIAIKADKFEQVFKQPVWYSFDDSGVHFVVAGAVTKEKQDAFADWLQKDLTVAKDAAQVIVLSSWIPREKTNVANVMGAHRITAWLGGITGAAGPSFCRVADVPVITAPALGWPGKFLYSTVTVDKDGLTLKIVPRYGGLAHYMRLPNARSGEPTAVAKDAHYLAEYRRDCETKPLLTFVQISDTQLDDGAEPAQAGRYKTAKEISSKAVDQINRLDPQPAFVVATGDLTNKCTEAEWQMFDSLVAKKLRATLYTLSGNHDGDRPKGAKVVEDMPVMLDAYCKATGAKPYYTWQAGGINFIALNTASAAMDLDQIKWLNQQLDQLKGKPVIVTGHHPLDPGMAHTVLDGREETVKLLADRHVMAYLFGHRHAWTCSTKGGFLNYGCNDLCWSGDNGYVVYQVFNDRIEVSYKPLEDDCFWKMTYSLPQTARR